MVRTGDASSSTLEPLMKDPGMAAVFDYCAAANAWRVEDAETKRPVTDFTATYTESQGGIAGEEGGLAAIVE